MKIRLKNKALFFHEKCCYINLSLELIIIYLKLKALAAVLSYPEQKRSLLGENSSLLEWAASVLLKI